MTIEHTSDEKTNEEGKLGQPSGEGEYPATKAA